ncbi:MAG: MCE family protein [Candidatus Cloacimonetes bacterium]|nr:MCE family protein [Candidatus Cloacimonadota bacterium]
MVSKSQKIRLGVFIIVALVLLFIMVGIIVGTKLFDKKDFYFIEYKDQSVSGLNIGSAVQYHGIRVGRIEELSIDKEDVTTVIVEISVKEGTPIKTDVKAVMAAVGITGLKQIELIGGDPRNENLKPSSYIQPGESTLDVITDKAEDIANKIDEILRNIANILDERTQKNIQEVVDNTNSSLKNINLILDDNRESLNESIENIARISSELANLLTTINNVTQQLDLNQFNMTVSNINKSVDDLTEAFNNINYTVLESQDDIIETIRLLKESMQNINEFSRMISENPSLLLKSSSGDSYPGGP